MSHGGEAGCPRRMRTTLLIPMLLTLACELPPEDPSNPLARFPTQPRDQGALALSNFSGPTACADLEQHLEDRAVLEMRVSLELNKKYALQWFDWRQNAGGGL